MTFQHLAPPLQAFVILMFVFQLWMLADSMRRRSPLLWNVLIFLIPLAAILYFVFVKAPEMLGRRPAFSSSSRPGGSTLEEIAELARQTPSEANRLAFAEKLAELQRLPEAVGRYREVLRQNKDSKEALHGLARVLLTLGRPQEAVEELANLMELDREFRDYSAALDYAEALWKSGGQEDAIGLLTGLVSVSRRIDHRMALASYLKDRGDSVTARSELDQALRDFEAQPDSVRQRDHQWADRARKLLAELNRAA